LGLRGRTPAPARLSTFLLDLGKRREQAGGAGGNAVELPMSRSDIADYLGLTKETVSRVLALLKRRRLIRLAALDRVEILDRAGLADLAEGVEAA
jgi:CRP-like cAMP-binding protein